jgi:hypothetical protein
VGGTGRIAPVAGNTNPRHFILAALNLTASILIITLLVVLLVTVFGDSTVDYHKQL